MTGVQTCALPICASLGQYYLGKNFDNVTLSDCKKLFINLFSDAVSSGAVFLPSPYGHKDFAFKMVKRVPPPTRRAAIPVQEVHIIVTVKGKPQSRRYLHVHAQTIPFFAFGSNSKVFSCRLSSQDNKDFIRRAAKNANIALSHVFPVVLEYNNCKSWFLDGMLHREDGPAVVMFDSGVNEWWVEGQLHRVDGPAVERFDGDNEWWFDGVELDEWKVRRLARNKSASLVSG